MYTWRFLPVRLPSEDPDWAKSWDGKGKWKEKVQRRVRRSSQGRLSRAGGSWSGGGEEDEPRKDSGGSPADRLSPAAPAPAEGRLPHASGRSPAAGRWQCWPTGGRSRAGRGSRGRGAEVPELEALRRGGLHRQSEEGPEAMSEVSSWKRCTQSRHLHELAEIILTTARL